MADMSQLQTVEGLMSAIYDYCGNPPEDKLSPSQVLNALFDRIQHYRNEMNLTDEGWFIAKDILPVQSGVEEYQLSFAGMGRPFFVETYDSSNPRFRRTEIEIARAQDRDEYTDVDAYQIASIKHSARVFIFDNIGTPSPIAQVLPVPSASAEYRIWYESIINDEPDLDDVPMFLKHFFNLLKVAVCLDVIDFCDWPKDKRDGIVQMRGMAYTEYHSVFQNYITEMYHSQNSTITASCSSRMSRRGGKGKR